MLESHEGFSGTYPASAESVPRVRSALTRFASEVGVDGERLEAIRLAASEGVTNGVLHAYRSGGGGTIQVTASYVGDEFWLLIADDGTGLRPRSPHSGLGLGLALISQLADEFQILSRSTGGTELRMQFKTDHRDPPGRRTGTDAAQLRGSVSSAFVPA
jgi:stage II sporulation protein AB (anti-sigma F factor)